jgi:putative PIN family toxin of toxin-antitoxin system
MRSEARFVVDTNAMVSAFLLKTSIPRRAFDRARTAGTILLSGPTLQELGTVLMRQKFDRYFQPGARAQLLLQLLREAEQVAIMDVITACRDPKDDKFLDVAVNGRAICLMSGDPDLLALHPFRGIPILTPRAFLDFTW